MSVEKGRFEGDLERGLDSGARSPSKNPSQLPESLTSELGEHLELLDVTREGDTGSISIFGSNCIDGQWPHPTDPSIRVPLYELIDYVLRAQGLPSYDELRMQGLNPAFRFEPRSPSEANDHGVDGVIEINWQVAAVVEPSVDDILQKLKSGIPPSSLTEDERLLVHSVLGNINIDEPVITPVVKDTKDSLRDAVLSGDVATLMTLFPDRTEEEIEAYLGARQAEIEHLRESMNRGGTQPDDVEAAQTNFDTISADEIARLFAAVNKVPTGAAVPIPPGAQPADFVAARTAVPSEATVDYAPIPEFKESSLTPEQIADRVSALLEQMTGSNADAWQQYWGKIDAIGDLVEQFRAAYERLLVDHSELFSVEGVRDQVGLVLSTLFESIYSEYPAVWHPEYVDTLFFGILKTPLRGIELSEQDLMSWVEKLALIHAQVRRMGEVHPEMFDMLMKLYNERKEDVRLALIDREGIPGTREALLAVLSSIDWLPEQEITQGGPLYNSFTTLKKLEDLKPTLPSTFPNFVREMGINLPTILSNLQRDRDGQLLESNRYFFDQLSALIDGNEAFFDLYVSKIIEQYDPLFNESFKSIYEGLEEQWDVFEEQERGTLEGTHLHDEIFSRIKNFYTRVGELDSILEKGTSLEKLMALTQMRDIIIGTVAEGSSHEDMRHVAYYFKYANDYYLEVLHWVNASYEPQPAQQVVAEEEQPKMDYQEKYVRTETARMLLEGLAPSQIAIILPEVNSYPALPGGGGNGTLLDQVNRDFDPRIMLDRLAVYGQQQSAQVEDNSLLGLLGSTLGVFGAVVGVGVQTYQKMTMSPEEYDISQDDGLSRRDKEAALAAMRDAAPVDSDYTRGFLMGGVARAAVHVASIPVIGLLKGVGRMFEIIPLTQEEIDYAEARQAQINAAKAARKQRDQDLSDGWREHDKAEQEARRLRDKAIHEGGEEERRIRKEKEQRQNELREPIRRATTSPVASGAISGEPSNNESDKSDEESQPTIKKVGSFWKPATIDDFPELTGKDKEFTITDPSYEHLTGYIKDSARMLQCSPADLWSQVTGTFMIGYDPFDPKEESYRDYLVHRKDGSWVAGHLPIPAKVPAPVIREARVVGERRGQDIPDYTPPPDMHTRTSINEGASRSSTGGTPAPVDSPYVDTRTEPLTRDEQFEHIVANKAYDEAIKALYHAGWDMNDAVHRFRNGFDAWEEQVRREVAEAAEDRRRYGKSDTKREAPPIREPGQLPDTIIDDPLKDFLDGAHHRERVPEPRKL
ncbi:MAG: hypothetical protein M3Q44_02830 [bacterium]|nr:hypothetical protein [bacterium]